ncbi:MAG TPA: hypothetical protein DEF42_10525 [Desulfosporosinus sp.]|nr:hypothetical protein [Desulfosporosinus sp.]
MSRALKLIAKLVHKEALRVFRTYWKISTSHEKWFDFLCSISATLFLLIIISYANFSFANLTKFFEGLFGTILTILSVLAGFNVTSVTILSSSQSPVILKMRSTPLSDGKNNELTQFVCYFSWAIILQLTILLYSILLFFFVKILTPIYINLFIFAVALWLFGILYSILLSVRNASNIFLFFIVDSNS